MARILVYGGCHATVIQGMLQKLIPNDAAAISVLTNFELIHAGVPFPYEQLSDFDVVVFSPIENKNSYNTSILEDHCRCAGVRTICFPWLEWHGYTPGAVKGVFRGVTGWHYPELENIASHFTDFLSFRNHVIRSYPSDEVLTTTLERTTELLRLQQDRHATDVKVADFVQDRFQSSRLFLTPDHPSASIYKYVVSQLVDLLDMSGLVVEDYLHEEPQAGLRTPIFPKVARSLDLEFVDAVWVDASVLTEASVDLETYLMQYFYKSAVLIAPLPGATFLSAADEVPPHTRLLAQPIDQTPVDRPGYRILHAFSGRLPTEAPFMVHAEQWKELGS